jgi:superfamily I DNA and/or RNA helicase
MIHGPPGTGKSQTLVVILEALFKSNKKVLVCAESHNPIDNLLSKFVHSSNALQSLSTEEKRAALIRIGASWLVDKKSKEFLLDNRLKSYRRNQRAARGARSHSLSRSHSPSHHSQDTTTADNRLKLALISRARMVFSTKCGLFNKLFRDHFAHEENKFDYAIVDEASQSFTAYTLMAIACAKKIIFAGDHEQLPPVIKDEAAKQELEVSLFERLINHQKLNPPTTPVYTMLDTQYRMNELLMKFSNDLLYEGQVKTGQRNKDLLLKDIVSNGVVTTLPLDQPIVWIKNRQQERCFEEGNVTNHQEALIVIKAIKELIRIGVPQTDIGVIVGYNAQRTLIFNMIVTDRSMRYVGVNVDELMIATVDSFQGREREVIIFATTRSNQYKKVGFFKDARRLNVAATRARRQLIVVGDQNTLNNRQAKFAQLFRVAQNHGAVIEEF